MALDQPPAMMTPYADRSALRDPIECLKAYQASQNARLAAMGTTVEDKRRISIGGWNPAIIPRTNLLAEYLDDAAERHMSEPVGTFYFVAATNGERGLYVTDHLGLLLLQDVRDPRLPRLERVLSSDRIEKRQSRLRLPAQDVLNYEELPINAGPLYLQPDELGLAARLIQRTTTS